MRRTMRIVSMNGVVMVLAVAVLSAGLIAGDDDRAAQGPCADDIAKYCKDMKPGDGRIAGCLKENEKQLSSACRSSIEESKKRSRKPIRPVRATPRNSARMSSRARAHC